MLSIMLVKMIWTKLLLIKGGQEKPLRKQVIVNKV